VEVTVKVEIQKSQGYVLRDIIVLLEVVQHMHNHVQQALIHPSKDYQDLINVTHAQTVVTVLQLRQFHYHVLLEHIII
jgi:hypothetical protein